MKPGDPIAKASHYATQTHARIDQRRKYTAQPVDVHLRAVAEIVRSVADDPEMIAAAWLHDIVEDTPATLDDVEREFGPAIRSLVGELTDVSRLSDGNREIRKAIDREHLGRASARAQTIKLADLIDNCDDICKHDERFGRVFLREMRALLDVLRTGDGGLHERATRLHERWTARLEASGGAPQTKLDEFTEFEVLLRSSRTVRRFASVFAAQDIAEPLRSFDRTRPLAEVAEAIARQGPSVIGVRTQGRVTGYLWVESARSDKEHCGDVERAFDSSQVLDASEPLSAVIEVLTLHDACFVRILGDVHGVITRAEIQKPLVRMWLFGLITLVEMRFDERIRAEWPQGEWTARLSEGRLEKARQLRDDRRRRGDACELVDCLQFADRAQILTGDARHLAALGFESRSAARGVMKELQSLRNKLAHAQDIVTHDWAPIARLARRLEWLVR